MTRTRASLLAGLCSRGRASRAPALALALALALGACGGDDAPPAAQPDTEPETEATEDGGGDAGAMQVAMVDNDFAPSMVSLSAGEVTINLANNGDNPHTFTIDELDVDTGIVDSGDRTEITFTVPDGGEIEFYCTVHGRETMSGTITVE